MKKSLIAIAVIPFVMAVAASAEAKGAMPQSAVMTGPGLDSPMTFGDPTSPAGTTTDGNVVLLANETKLFETLFGGDLTATANPDGKLGPRYEIMWTMRRELHPHRTFDLRSDLYPYAKDGAVMYTHGGQKVRDVEGAHILHSGWAAANPVIVQNLQAWGLPQNHLPAAGKPTSSAIAPLWIVVGLFALIVIAALRARLRTRAQTL
ncbi:MAG: hypothetical protein M3P18_10240 [Actinomycetota bacterium]|nr:hypothetical protein [Actinomycetota bacterium]